jgi:hypothetical protein
MVNEKVLKIIDNYWGEFLFLLDEIMREKLIEWEIANIVWNRIFEIRDVINENKRDFWILEEEDKVVGYLEKDGIMGKVVVKVVEEEILLVVKGIWGKFIWEVALEAGKLLIPELTFSVILKLNGRIEYD